MLRGRQLSAGFTWKPYVILGDHQNLKILWRSPDTSCSITTTCGTATQVTDGLLDTGDHFMYEVNFLSGIPICTGETFLNYTVACSMGGNNYEESGSVLLPPASSTERTKFIAYGDTRSYPADHNNVAGSILTNSDAYRGLILHVGDYVNDGSCISQWDTQFFDPLRTNISDMLMGSPMNGCRGNHENYGGCYSDMGAADDYHTLYDNIFPFDWATHYYEPAACTSPAPPGASLPSLLVEPTRHLSYSFDYGAFHVAVVDQYGPKRKGKHGTAYSNGAVYDGDYATCGTEYFKWLNCDLARTTQPFKLVVLHEPLYSAGTRSNLFVPDLDAILQDNNVDVVAGHNHYYARASVPNMRGYRSTPGGGTSQRCIAHITTGGGGAPLYGPGTGYPHIKKTSVVHHHTRFDSYSAGNAATDYFCFEAVDNDGNVFDCLEHGDRPTSPDEWNARLCGQNYAPVNNVTCDTIDDCGNEGCTSSNNCDATPICEGDVMPCDTNTDCVDDGSFCNGSETCNNGACESSGDPCPEGKVCKEDTETCENPSSDICIPRNADCSDDPEGCCGDFTCRSVGPNRKCR